MNDQTPRRMLLVDNDADVRKALALLLSTVLDLHVAGKAADLSGSEWTDSASATLLDI